MVSDCEACSAVEQVSLKSRGSARRRENTNENLQLPVDTLDDVMNDIIGLTTLAGKYALYRPRPGKNVSPARRLETGVETGDENINENEAEPLNDDNASATCPPATELTSIYENIDKAMIYHL